MTDTHDEQHDGDPHAWKGARMSSTAWEHNYSCCSEKCGLEFLNSKKHKAILLCGSGETYEC